MTNRRLNQFSYSFQRKIVNLQVKWQVLATNPNGGTVVTNAPGIGTFGGPSTASVTYGQGINQFFGYSSAPATGNNQASGTFGIQFSDDYNQYLSHSYAIVSPVTGSAINLTTGLTAGVSYQIVTVGTSTAANWQAVGFPVGVTPVAGAGFVASTSSPGTGTGTVKAVASSQVTSIELIADPTYTLSPFSAPQAFNGSPSGWAYFAYYKTATLQQPTDGTIVMLNIMLAGQ